MSHLEAIYIAAEKGGPLTRIESARVVVDRGIEGDRYFDGRGSFSRWPGGGRAISMIAAETIEAIANEHGIDLSKGKSRRNFVTRGVLLDALVNQTFAIGEVIFFGSRLCAPCRYLERLISPGLYDAIKGRGGLRADVLQSGTVREGDAVRALGRDEVLAFRSARNAESSLSDHPQRAVHEAR